MKTQKRIFNDLAHRFGYWLRVKRKSGEDRRHRYISFAAGAIVTTRDVLRNHMTSLAKDRRRELGRTIAGAIKGGQI